MRWFLSALLLTVFYSIGSNAGTLSLSPFDQLPPPTDSDCYNFPKECRRYPRPTALGSAGACVYLGNVNIQRISSDYFYFAFDYINRCGVPVQASIKSSLGWSNTETIPAGAHVYIFYAPQTEQDLPLELKLDKLGGTNPAPQPQPTPPPVDPNLPLPISSNEPGICLPGVGSTKIQGFSTLNMETLSFTEEIPVADAPFSLIYISERYSDRIRKGLDPDIGKSFVGGWWLSIHSYYSWKTNTIYYGNGDKQVLNFTPKAESDGSVLLLNPSASNYSEYDSDGDLRYTKSAYSHKKLLNVSYKGDYVDITDAYGKVWRTDYTKGEIISPNGVKTIFVKNESGKLVLVRLPNGATYEMTYDSNYRLATFKKPLGKVTTFVYDKEGNLQKDIRSDGRYIEITSTSKDKIMNAYATTNSGLQRRYEIAGANYGTHRNVHTEYGAMSSVLNRTAEKDTHVWDIYGGKTEMVHADDPRWGVESKYLRSYSFKAGSINITRKQTSTYNNGILQYNIVHQNDAKKTYRFLVHMKPDEVLTGIQTPEARFATRTYNNFGDILNSSSGSITQSYSYDQKGRLTQVTAGGNNTKFEYGANGDLNKVIDPLGLQYLFEYDSVKRVSKATYPNGSFVSFSYDLEGNLIGIKPPSKPMHTFSFNQNGLPVAYLAPLVATVGDTSTEIRYDSEDRVSQILQGGKTAVAYKFGVNDSRLMKVEHSHGSTDISYALNPDKKPTDLVGSLQTSDGVRTSYSYIWKLPEVVWTQGEVIHTLKYKYNPDASLAAIEVAGKDGKLFSTGFKYDLDGLLVGAGSLKYVIDKSGRIESSALGVVNTKTQYNDYLVTAETVTANKKSIWITNLNRDALGRIVSENSNGTATTYEYDSNGRLVRATQNGVVRTYEYDQNGNRTAFKSGNTVINGQYDEQDRLLSYGRFKFSYSDAGNLVKKEEFQGPTSAPLITTYDYDTLGNLRKVVLPDGRIIEYVIDGQNRRIGKKINGQLAQGFIYQTQYQIAAETDGAGNIIRRFVYGSKINIPDYVVTGGKEYRVISNQVGTPKAIVESSTGKIVETLSYDEFGVSLDGKRSSYLPFGFAGGLSDSDTSLLRFGARDYDPSIGRWTSKDPIGFNGGDTNLYNYVANDPMSYIDPEGTFLLPVAVGMFIGAMLTPTPIDQQITALQEGIRVATGAFIGGATAAYIYGTEFVLGGMRFAPFGNRSGKWQSELPHYHRRGVNPNNGETIPGQGIGRHRPWDIKSPDKNFCDRF